MKISLFILSFFLTQSLFSQNGSITGKITTTESKQPLPGATVIIENTNYKTITDSKGIYLLNNIPPGEYSMIVSFTGFISYSKNFKLKENEAEKKDISLDEKTTRLTAVNVFTKINAEEETSSRTNERKANNIRNIISAKAMERSPDINAANVLQRMSGITLQKNSGADEAYAIVRGLEPRYNNTLINGVKIASPDEKSRFISLDVIPSDLLQKIEISKSLLPEMEGDATGGTVNLVMKDAPDSLLFKAVASIGYSSIFFDRKFVSFSKKDIQSKNLTDRHGAGYIAQSNDFSRSNLDFKEKNALPNGTFGITYGKRFLQKKLGMLLALNFQNQYYGANSLYNQAVPDTYKNEPAVSDVANRYISTQQLNSGITMHLDYNFNNHNKLIITNLLLYSYLAQEREVIDTAIKGGNGGRTVAGTGPVYRDYSSITNHQLIENLKIEGKHILSNSLLLDWAAVFSDAVKRTPDRANLSINKKIDTVHTTNDINGPYNFVNTPYYFDDITRIWQHNNDRDYNILANITYKSKIKAASLEIKAGGLYRHKTRYNIQNQYDLRPTTNSNGVKQVYNDINSAQWVVYNTGGTQAYDINNYKLFENITAGFGQAKVSLKQLDIFGGIRIEKTAQGFTLNTFYPTGINGITKNYTDVLPSTMLKYKLNNKTNIRLSYFKSISRPNYYELVPATILSSSTPTAESGNPDLKHSIADNFDFRYELFPKDEEQLFIGAFYKKIKDPIEYAYVDINSYKPQNLGTAIVYGTELVYTKYFGNIGITGNYTYIWSKISSPKFYTDVIAQTTNPQKLQSRPMQGQTDHSLNFSLLYKNEKKKLFAQLSYEYLGKTLARVYPVYGYDYYQSPQSFLAVSAEKQLSNRHFTVFGKFNNLLNTATVNKINNLLVVKDSYKANFSIGLRYSN